MIDLFGDAMRKGVERGRRIFSNSWQCLECGKKFASAEAAERAANSDSGCPKCGGSDIDDVPETQNSSDPRFVVEVKSSRWSVRDTKGNRMGEAFSTRREAADRAEELNMKYPDVEKHNSDEKCFACGKKLGEDPTLVDTRDGQTAYIGSECAKFVSQAGESGYQPPRGGPKLYPLKNSSPRQFLFHDKDGNGFSLEANSYEEAVQRILSRDRIQSLAEAGIKFIKEGYSFENSSTIYVCNEDNCDFETRDHSKARNHFNSTGHEIVETDDDSYARKNSSYEDAHPIYRVTYDGPHVKGLQVELHLGPQTDAQIKQYFQDHYVQPTKIHKIERVNSDEVDTAIDFIGVENARAKSLDDVAHLMFGKAYSELSDDGPEQDAVQREFQRNDWEPLNAAEYPHDIFQNKSGGLRAGAKKYGKS